VRKWWSGVLSLAGSVLLVIAHTLIEWSAVPPCPVDQLGLSAEHQAEAQQVAATLPAFAIAGDDGADHVRKNIRLWDLIRRVRGDLFPNIPQQVGDCVSWGASNAIICTQAAQAAAGDPIVVERPSTLWLYGASRVLIGKGRLRGDGSVGAWAAQASVEPGVVSAEHPQMPAYSGSEARKWGSQGPPKWAIEAAGNAKIGAIAQMKRPEDVVLALKNGYGVSVASNYGTRTIREQDGRMVARWDASWAHQMCIDGYDGSHPSGRRYFHFLNSWGPDAHSKPIDDSPPGGFWVPWDDVAKILQQGDTWSFGGFDGFKRRELDWNVFQGAQADFNGGVREIIMRFHDGFYEPLVVLGIALIGTAIVLILFGRMPPTKMAAWVLCLSLATSAVAAEPVSFAAFEPLSFAAFEPVSFAAWEAVDARPEMIGYTPTWCGPCQLWKRERLKDASIRWVFHDDDSKYPAWVKTSAAERPGYPVLHYQVGDKWRTVKAKPSEQEALRLLQGNS
jgi:hypothetical protein